MNFVGSISVSDACILCVIRLERFFLSHQWPLFVRRISLSGSSLMYDYTYVFPSKNYTSARINIVVLVLFKMLFSSLPTPTIALCLFSVPSPFSDCIDLLEIVWVVLLISRYSVWYWRRVETILVILVCNVEVRRVCFHL